MLSLSLSPLLSLSLSPPPCFLLRQQYGCLTLESHRRKGEKPYVEALRATRTALRLIKRKREPLANNLGSAGNWKPDASRKHVRGERRRERERESRRRYNDSVRSVKRGTPGKIVRKVCPFRTAAVSCYKNHGIHTRVSLACV